MKDTDTWINWVAGGGGVVLLTIVVRWVLNVFGAHARASVSGSESQVYTHQYLAEELEKCRQRDEKYREMILELAELRTKLRIATMEIERQGKLIDELNAEISRLQGSK